MSPSTGLESSPAWDAEALADLVLAVGTEAFYESLHRHLEERVSFQNFIVLLFETRRTAQILHANLAIDTLRLQMAPYLRGLYELDPFIVARSHGNAQSFLVMDEICPEEFAQTDFYLSYYTNIAVTQETRFIVPLQPERWIHVLAERERPAADFSMHERAVLRAIASFVCAAVLRHSQLCKELGAGHIDNRAIPCNLIEVLRRLRSGTLSSREVQIAESLLQGQSPKAISRQLQISLDTVANHKRHIYEKLDIHSQAQLFNLVLLALMSETSASELPSDLQ